MKSLGTTVDDTVAASELVGRLFDALIGEIRERWPEYLHSRFTVAEIYQNLIPWRTHRDTMGIATSGEYEQALLRLLAGEGDYLALESEHAREEIQAELASRFPNTGLYRDFAAVGVRLNPTRVPVRDAAPERGTTAPDGVAGDGPGRARQEAEAAAGPGATAAAQVRPDGGAAAGKVCSGCNRELPAIEGVRFCPFCGQDARIIACAECGMRIEAEWSYCVGCGRQARRV